MNSTHLLTLFQIARLRVQTTKKITPLSMGPGLDQTDLSMRYAFGDIDIEMHSMVITPPYPNFSNCKPLYPLLYSSLLFLLSKSNCLCHVILEVKHLTKYSPGSGVSHYRCHHHPCESFLPKRVQIVMWFIAKFNLCIFERKKLHIICDWIKRMLGV